MKTPVTRKYIYWLLSGAAAVLIGFHVFFNQDSGDPVTGTDKNTRAASPNVVTAANRRSSPPAPRENSLPQAKTTSANGDLPPLDAPVATYFESLKKRALNGDAKAACRLAYDIEGCTSGLESARYFVREYERLLAPANTRLGTQEIEATRRAMSLAQAELKAYESRCRGFELAADELKPWQYMLQAAHGGQTASMNRFVYGIGMGLSTDQPVKSLEGWMAYRDNARFILDKAVSTGDSFSFYLAARAYEGPAKNYGLTIYEPSATQAITYYAAASARASAHSAPHFEREITRIAKESLLSSAQVESARQAGRTLAATQPNPGPKPLDVSQSYAHGGMPIERCGE